MYVQQKDHVTTPLLYSIVHNMFLRTDIQYYLARELWPAKTVNLIKTLYYRAYPETESLLCKGATHVFVTSLYTLLCLAAYPVVDVKHEV